MVDDFQFRLLLNMQPDKSQDSDLADISGAR